MTTGLAELRKLAGVTGRWVGRHGPVEAKGKTFAQAREALYQYLAKEDWKLNTALKIPHATSPDGQTRLWFKTQAVYFSHGKPPHTMQDALSLHADIRTDTIEAFMAEVKRRTTPEKKSWESAHHWRPGLSDPGMLAEKRVGYNVKKMLVGHTDEASAYMVDDYPYGRQVRTRIRYWLEHTRGKGWRFVAQTEEPKKKIWNKPKKSTYAELGGAMYLDDKDHVQWAQINAYADIDQVEEFVDLFSHADMSVVKQFVVGKVNYLAKVVSGAAVWTINGTPMKRSDAENDRDTQERERWLALAPKLGLHLTPKSKPQSEALRRLRSRGTRPLTL